MSYYDCIIKDPKYFREEKGLEGKIIHISPDDYMKACAIGRTAEPSWSSWSIEQEHDAINPRLVDDYSEDMKKGDKFPMPVLYYVVHDMNVYTGQEGRHRAMAAKKLGDTKIPTLLVYPTNPEEYNKVLPLIQWMLKR
jgi:hypothetical protein